MSKTRAVLVRRGDAPLPFPGESPRRRRRPLGGARTPRAAPALAPGPEPGPGPGPQPGPVASSLHRSATVAEAGPRSEAKRDSVGRRKRILHQKHTLPPQTPLLPPPCPPRPTPVPIHPGGGVARQRQWEAVSPLCASCGVSARVGNWQRLGRRL